MGRMYLVDEIGLQASRRVMANSEVLTIDNPEIASRVIKNCLNTTNN